MMRLAPLLLLTLAACDPSPAQRPLETPSSKREPMPSSPPAVAPSAPAPAPPPADAPRTDVAPPAAPERAYPWPREAAYEPLAARFPAPEGSARIPADAPSWGHWLRHLPLLPAGRPVLAYDGDTILDGDDRRLAAVLDLDVVPGDLQQCVDSILRLRAEYLHSVGRDDDISFQYTNAWESRWSPWKDGYRPRLVDPRTVEMRRAAKPGDDRAVFVKYLRDLFNYAGTVSVAREAREVSPEDLSIGDFFILPGGPGHAVLVVDLARDAEGQRYALLAQGFMPAQQMHVLQGPADGWWPLTEGEPVPTPFWKPFPWSALRRL